MRIIFDIPDSSFSIGFSYSYEDEGNKMCGLRSLYGNELYDNVHVYCRKSDKDLKIQSEENHGEEGQESEE